MMQKSQYVFPKTFIFCGFFILALCSLNLFDSVNADISEFSDIIDCCCILPLKVSYDGEPLTKTQNLILIPSQASTAPQLTFNPDSDSQYTIIMIDPDAPSQKDPIYRSWLHWLCVNAPGNNTQSAQTVASYKGPSPPMDTGYHRYIFLVYKQAHNIDASTLSNLETERRSFNIKDFVTKHELGDAKYCFNFKAQNQKND